MDSLSSKSTTATTIASTADLHGGVDMLAVLATGGADLLSDKKRKVSISGFDEKGVPLDLVVFSDSVRMPTNNENFEPNSVIQFALDNLQPDTKKIPEFESGKMLGNVPLVSEFHMESNRERIGPLDDGLEDEDLTAADGIFRKKKSVMVKRKSIIYDNIRSYKGEFTFPYRTYRPKVQVAYKGTTNQVPQAVVVERLHRIFKRTDINLVLQTLGIEASDLIPPPNYSEGNERFYQEMMFRNRVRVNGMFKKDFILHGPKLEGQRNTDEGSHVHLHAPKDENGSSVSYPTTSSEREESVSSSSVVDSSAIPEDENPHIHVHHVHDNDGIHPFIKFKPPFGHMFPLHCFDNTEFDIRTPENWMDLSWDSKERRYYPLPGKAFLPIPANSSKKNSQALSEFIVDHLLTSSPRLEKLFHWLLRERFDRTIMQLGIDPNKVKFSPTEMDLSLLARLGSTVQSLAQNSSDLLRDGGLDFKSSLLKAGEESVSITSVLSQLEAIIGENSSGDSGSDPKKIDHVELGGQMVPLYNVVYKKRVERLPDEDDEFSDDEDNDQTVIGEVKKIQPAVVEAASEIETPTIMDDDAEVVKTEAIGEETDAEDIELDTESKDYITGATISKGITQGDYGPVRPTSPDVDKLMDGHEKYVFDYDKMKKVHIYDWQWVEVAVFDHNKDTDRYYVRSIYPPVVHAWVHKIYLCFDGEDPNKHGHRIKDAVIRRIENENMMRLNLYIDCLPMDGIPSIETKAAGIILSKSVSTPRVKFSEKAIIRAQKEVELEYKRTYARTKFFQVTAKHPHLYKPWVTIPEESDKTDPTKEWKRLQEISSEIPKQNFQYKVKKIQKLSVIFQQEPFEALKKINEICLEAKRKCLIIVDNLEPLHLDDWETRQEENIAEIRQYLQTEWYQLVLDTLNEQLGKIPQSWYNLKELNYDVFVMSKLSNYLNLIKMRMQDTLRSIVTESLERFIFRVQEVSKDCDLKKKFTWQENDLITSLYPTPKDIQQIWVLELYMDTDGPKYSNLLSSFGHISTKMFNLCIEAVKELPSLLAQVMPQMSFASHGFLNSPEDTEPGFKVLHSKLQKYVKRALLPIDTYVQLYKKYQDVWNLDIPTFIKEWEAGHHTADEVQALVESHMQHADQLEKEIPHAINITGFKIVVEVIREGLLKKKRTLFSTIIETYAHKLKKLILRVREEYSDIEKKLNTRSDDIEEVMELKRYVASVPAIVAQLEEITSEVIKDYDVFDKFMHAIPNDDVNAKWQAAMSSGRILRMTKQATKWLDEDYTRLLDVQQYDWSSLSDQVDYATLSVAGLVAYTELDKAIEVAQEVKKIWRTVKDLQDQGILLNKRQKIFGLPPMQSHALERLVNDIEPYKHLWFVASDWTKVQETVFGGTLEKVDIDNLTKLITEGMDVIEKCIEYFTGADQIQLIASTVKYQIDNFYPLLPLIRTLKNVGMRQRHWEAASDICGFPVVAKGTQNFKKLLEQGIEKFVEQITEIGELATKEYEIELELDKMAYGISLHQVKLAMDTITMQPVISLSESATATMIEYIQQTDEILQNPYNAPFEHRLSIWNTKIRAAKENMEIWFQNQKDWLLIEPTFKSPDVAIRLPVEFKMFEKMQRIWRRLIRLARDNPDLIELASDTTVMTSLYQFSDLVRKIRKELEEHQKPKNSDEESD